MRAIIVVLLLSLTGCASWFEPDLTSARRQLTILELKLRMLEIDEHIRREHFKRELERACSKNPRLRACQAKARLVV